MSAVLDRPTAGLAPRYADTIARRILAECEDIRQQTERERDLAETAALSFERRCEKVAILDRRLELVSRKLEILQQDVTPDLWLRLHSATGSELLRQCCPCGREITMEAFLRWLEAGCDVCEREVRSA